MLSFENKDVHMWFIDSLGKQSKEEETRKELEYNFSCSEPDVDYFGTLQPGVVVS